MAKYGQTWWGEQWLDSLSNIDYSNRLPRGKSYANKGAVESLKIKDNRIQAKVSGSQTRPYTVTIIAPPFEPKDEERLIDRISKNPVLIARLLNRELDPEILQIAEALGIKVFPAAWNDLKMNCSCPDWAVPCKHLAAVIYKMSSEIDNNPFLVFELHRINLIEALKKRNIAIERQAEAQLPDIKEILHVMTNAAVRKTGRHKEHAEKLEIDFSTIPDILEPLIRVLPDEPAFYIHGNFRESYAKTLKRAARYARQVLSGKQVPAARKASLSYEDTLQIIYDEQFRPKIYLNDKKEITEDNLMSALLQIPSARLEDYTPSVQAMHELLFFSLNLLGKGAVTPQIFTCQKKVCCIRWLPAVPEQEVRNMINSFEQIIPDRLLSYDSGRLSKSCGHQPLSLSAFYLTYFVREWGMPDKTDSVHELFFSAKSQLFNRPGETAIPAGIAAWLARLHITHRHYVPVLKVDETKDEQFAVSINMENRKDMHELPVPLSMILKERRYEKYRYDILQDLSLLSGLVKDLDSYVRSGAEKPLVFGAQEFAPFLFEVLPAIKLLDIRSILPKSLQHILKPKTSMLLKKKDASEKSFMRLDDLLDFDWRVAIGDDLLDEKTFLQLMKRSHGIIRFRNRYIYLDPKELERLQKNFRQPRHMSSLDLLRTALSEEYMGARVELSREAKELIKKLTGGKPIPVPKGLQATLRPYQTRGFSWIYRNTRIGFGSLLADDMGLGKTLQVITVLMKFKEEGFLDKAKVLVIAPTSLLTNWSREFTRFAPSLSVLIYHGAGRKLPVKKTDVLLTSYGVVRSDREKLKKQKWFAVVADEAQNIKNKETAQTRAVKAIPAQTCIAMSGTPVENRLMEYWSIMDFANGGLLGTENNFLQEFARPIQSSHDEQVLDRFKKITSPFLLRRLKSDKSIISDLPDKIEQNQYCCLSKEQAALYETTMMEAMQAIEAMGNEKENELQRQGLVLKMITSLKQICNHPTQFLKNKQFDPALSGKTQLLLEILETMNDNREKTLIFTQFTEMALLLQRFIHEKFGHEPLYLHGGQSRLQRDAMVQRFQHEPQDRFFILSLKAGGTGLNLTAAQNVIHYDLWWNPAVEAQATDRAFRIGQQKNVMVHRFITQGTFEERIDEMIQSKKALADISVATGESWIGNMSNKELKEVFGL